MNSAKNHICFTVALLAVIYYNSACRLFRMFLRDSRVDYFPMLLVLLTLLVYKRLSSPFLDVKHRGLVLPGIVLVSVGLLLQSASERTSVLSLSVISLALVVSGIIVAARGPAWLSHMLFPVLFILFFLPLPHIWESILGTPLRISATRASAWNLTLMGWKAAAAGNILLLPGNTELLIGTPCSGIRSLTALMIICCFLAAFLRGMKSRLLLLGGGFLLVLASNIIRITTLGALAIHEGTWILDSPVHPLLGIMTFLLALTGITATWRWLDESSPALSIS